MMSLCTKTMSILIISCRSCLGSSSFVNQSSYSLFSLVCPFRTHTHIHIHIRTQPVSVKPCASMDVWCFNLSAHRVCCSGVVLKTLAYFIIKLLLFVIYYSCDNVVWHFLSCSIRQTKNTPPPTPRIPTMNEEHRSIHSTHNATVGLQLSHCLSFSFTPIFIFLNYNLFASLSHSFFLPFDIAFITISSC